MAPKRGMSIEPTDDREEFMTKLAEFHKKRGYVVAWMATERYTNEERFKLTDWMLLPLAEQVWTPRPK